MSNIYIAIVEAYSSLLHFRILMELGSADDSIWTYFDSQHNYIIGQMNHAYKMALSAIRSKPLHRAIVYLAHVFFPRGEPKVHTVESRSPRQSAG